MAAVIRRPRDGGFTLAEVVVAVALLSLLLLIAGRLLVASRRMEASLARVAAGPRLGVLAVQLRRDLESAVLVPGSGGGWSSLALGLVLKDGTAVGYDFDGENLTRVVTAGGSVRTRVIVPGIRSFRWRNLDGRTVDVKVSFPTSVVTAGSMSRSPKATDSTWWVRVAPRGSGWARRW